MNKYLPKQIHVLNVGGKNFDISQDLLDKSPDSVLEAIFSGRQEMEMVDGVPFIDRDPTQFRIVLSTLENTDCQDPFRLYQQIDSELQEELTFFGIDL